MSLGEMSRPLCGMPDSTTSSAHVDTSVAAAAERQNKTPSTSQVVDTCGFCHGYGHPARVG
jgi:cytochrome c553